MSEHSGFANYLNARSDTGGLGGNRVRIHDTGAPVGGGGPFGVRAAWKRPGRNALSDFVKARKRQPNAREKSWLQTQIREIKGGIQREEELTFEHHQGVLDFIMARGRMPTGYPARTGENFHLVNQADARVASHIGQYEAEHPSFLKSALKTLASPVTALGGLANDIAQGKNVLESLKSRTTEAISPAMAVLKPLSPALNVAAGLASFVPGLGTLASSALSVAAALGRGASVGDLALEAARGALPGGPITKVAFDVAVGVAKGESPTGIALAQIRNQIPGGDVGKAAFDAGLAVAYHAKPHEAAHAARALPAGKARETFAKPVLAAAKIRRLSPPKLAEVQRKRQAMTRARPLTKRAKTWLGRAIKIHAAQRLDTRGLNADGRTYTVERGDSAWRIAQNLTGDGNRHYRELLKANSPPKKLVNEGTPQVNFQFLRVGETLKIPKEWIGKFVAANGLPAAPVGGDVLSLPPATHQNPVQPAPKPPVSASPSDPIPAAPPAPVPPVTAPHPAGENRDDPAAIAQAKGIMVAWEHTDGAAANGLPDFGANGADQSPIWGPRDAYELRAFVVWSNAHGTALSLLGDLTQAKLDALVAWAENRAQQLATGQGSVSPTGMPAPTPTGGTTTVAPGPSPIPVEPGPSSLPPEAKPPGVIQDGVLPTEIIPETTISGSGEKKGGSGFGLGIAAMLLLGLGVAFSESGKRKAA